MPNLLNAEKVAPRGMRIHFRYSLVPASQAVTHRSRAALRAVPAANSSNPAPGF